MKALFVTFHGFNAANGISKKIRYQVNALKENGIDTRLCYLQDDKNGKKRMIDNQVLADYGTGVKAKVCKRTEYRSIVNYAIREQITLIYIRSDHNANPFTIRMVSKLKKAGIRVVMEIPTYPYDQEYATLRMKSELFIDKCFRHRLARHLDSIVTFSDYKTIFGKPTIQISNGIDFSEIPVKPHVNDTSRELHLIGVAEIHYWHGYDRLIKGLAAYYANNPEYKVYFHIVGDFFGQQERNQILPLVTQHHLEPYVILHGMQHGTLLNAIFDKCDMGIGSLGRHRSGITYIKTLKNREYAARGVPFIYSETDRDFENMPYILKVPADESPIEIQSLISFNRKVILFPAEIRESISHLSWTAQLKKVTDYITKYF